MNSQDKSKALGTRVVWCRTDDYSIMVGDWEEMTRVKQRAVKSAWGQVMENPQCRTKMVELISETNGDPLRVVEEAWDLMQPGC